MDYVYLVEISRGDYDDAVNWVAGAFDDLEQAEKYAKDLNEFAAWVDKRLGELEYMAAAFGTDKDAAFEFEDTYRSFTQWHGAEATPFEIGTRYTMIA